MKWWKEPLLHFFVAGALLYLYLGLVDPDDKDAQIKVSAERISVLKNAWQQRWRRPPSEPELKGLIDAEVNEEILYREALRLGLDHGDAVVRNRLIQKLRFLQHEGSQDPSKKQLEEYFVRHRDRYVQSYRWSFEQVYLGQSISLEQAKDLALLLSQGEQIRQKFESLLDVPSKMVDADSGQIEASFGQIFADGLTELAVGKWHAPVASGYGVHLVRINQKSAVEFDWDNAWQLQRLKNDWLNDQALTIEKQFIDTLRERYKVSVEGSLD